MRRAIAALAGVLLAASSIAAPAPTEAENVKAVVQSAYVEGVHARGDAALMRKGFHPDFRMLMLRDGQMTAVTLEEWIGRLEARPRNAAAPKPVIKADYPVVDVTGDAAVVRVELHRDGKHVFTDYLSLYKFADGWLIVGKIFQPHS